MRIIDRDIDFYTASLETFKSRLQSAEKKDETKLKSICIVSEKILIELKTLRELLNNEN